MSVFGKALKVQEVVDALVVSFGAGKSRGISRPAAVFDATGSPVARAVCRRDSRLKVTSTPLLPDPAAVTETLPGTWLFGGMLYAHFGHFLCESTARLWAMDAAGPRIEGVLFYPKKHVTRERRFLDPVQPWLTIAGIQVPVRLVLEPVKVARLMVPDQGFGTGDMIAAAPEYRAFVATHFGAKVAAKGPARIYISRTRLFAKRGRILGEAHLEALLEAEGYSIFHPQEHSIEDQIAQYKAADVVISTDCSALHLAAFFARPDTRVAIITRRPGATIDDFTNQYRSFAGVMPQVVSCVGQLHSAEGAKLGQMSEVYSEVDFPVLQGMLANLGFVETAAAWLNLPSAAIAAELVDLENRLGARIMPMKEAPA
jgi:capsular polysaccharide biosynthesis protein